MANIGNTPVSMQVHKNDLKSILVQWQRRYTSQQSIYGMFSWILYLQICLISNLLNPKKTKQMSFGTRNMVEKSKGVLLSVDGVPLQSVPTYKYL